MKNTLIILGILTLVVGIPVIKKFSSKEEKVVEVVTPQKRVIKSAVLASGRLAHEDQVRLTTEVIAKVKKVLVKEGDFVEKGQLLLVLDDEAFKATVEQRKASVRMQQIDIEKQKVQLEKFEKQWQRKKRLHEQKLLDDDAFDEFSSQLELARINVKSAKESLLQAQAQLSQAQDQLNKTRVLSPIKGKVTSLDIKEGETAIASTTNIAGSSLMTIADPNSTITEVFVDEADVANIEVGQTAKVVAIAYPDSPIEATVKSIATSAKSVAGRQGLSFLVKLNINDSGNIKLKPGMSCRAEIFTNSTSPVLSLPIQSIIAEEKRSEDIINHFVFVVENNVAKKIQIDTGNSDDSFQQVIAGLSESEQVIIGPDRVLRHLSHDEPVTVASQE